MLLFLHPYEKPQTNNTATNVTQNKTFPVESHGTSFK